jgi:DNA polymerase-1
LSEAESAPIAAVIAIPCNYETILDEAGLERWLERINAAAVTSFNTEAVGIDPMRAQLVGLSMCCEPGHAAYIPLAHNYAAAPER